MLALSIECRCGRAPLDERTAKLVRTLRRGGDPKCRDCLGSGRRPIPMNAADPCPRHGRFPTPPLLRLPGLPCCYCFVERSPLGPFFRKRNELLESNDRLGFDVGISEDPADAYFAIVDEGEGRYRAVQQASLGSPLAHDGIANIDPGPLAVHPGFVRVVGLNVWPTYWTDPDGGTWKDGSGRELWCSWGVAWTWVEVPQP